MLCISGLWVVSCFANPLRAPWPNAPEKHCGFQCFVDCLRVCLYYLLLSFASCTLRHFSIAYVFIAYLLTYLFL